MSGSIVCAQLLHSFTDVMKGASPLATNASGAIWWTILQLTQIAPSGGQIGTNALHYMLAKFETNSGGITWWSNFQLMQVVPCCC